MAGLRSPPPSVQPSENNRRRGRRPLHGLLFPGRFGRRPGDVHPEGNLNIQRFLFSLSLPRCAFVHVFWNVQIRAMQGCALCIFEQQKRRRSFSQKGLGTLLQVLNFLRIMMQVLQQYEHLCWHVYNGTHSLLSAVKCSCEIYILFHV